MNIRQAAAVLKRYRRSLLRFIPRDMREALDQAVMCLEMARPDFGRDMLEASGRIVEAIDIVRGEIPPTFDGEVKAIEDAANLIHWAIIVEGDPDNVDANVSLNAYLAAVPPRKPCACGCSHD